MTITPIGPNPTPEETWCRDAAGTAYTFDAYLRQVKAFHGHVAPGLVVGGPMVSVAMERLPEGILFDAVCETKSCLPDVVQMLTPCTIGNGWMRIVDMGRYAVTLFDKFEGGGVRVAIDPAPLSKWPEFYDWFYKVKPKKEQDFDRLIGEIRAAGTDVFKIENVQVSPSLLVKAGKGEIATCPVCKEAYPGSHGGICRGCQGHAPYAADAERDRAGAEGPRLAAVPVSEAVGRRALHDMTEIVPGTSKGPAVVHGQTIAAGDVCRLQKMGRNRIYVREGEDDRPGWIHENTAARAFAQGMCGAGLQFKDPPREGKATLRADRDGLFTADVDRLTAFNLAPGVMCACRKSFAVVKAGEALAGTRALPLYLSEADFQTAMAVLENGPLFAVREMRSAKIGVLVTGTEVFRGLVEDRFVPIVREKAAKFGSRVVASCIVPDDRKAIAEGVQTLRSGGADLLVTTAGLSVDPDDVTRLGLLDAGAVNLRYGAAVLPGAMTLLARIDEIPVLGVPACGLFHPTTSFDLLLPRLLAGLDVRRADLARLGHGAFCKNCDTCVYPHCAFGV
ncbi:MAG: FmdE family protein [Desulfococcaceae bacterium]